MSDTRGHDVRRYVGHKLYLAERAREKHRETLEDREDRAEARRER